MNGKSSLAQIAEELLESVAKFYRIILVEAFLSLTLGQRMNIGVRQRMGCPEFTVGIGWPLKDVLNRVHQGRY